MSRILLSGFFVCVFSVSTVDASLTTYGSRTAFNAAVTGQTMIDFETQQVSGSSGYTNHGSFLAVGSVYFIQPDNQLYTKGKDYHNTTGLSSSFLNNWGGPSNMVVSFTGGGIYSLGMDIGQLYPWGSAVGNLTLNLSSGDQVNLAGLLQLSNSSNPLTFVGFTSNTAITSMTIVDTSDSTVIDNFAFSSFSAVPEPTTLTTWGLLGLVGLAYRSRHSRRMVG